MKKRIKFHGNDGISGGDGVESAELNERNLERMQLGDPIPIPGGAKRPEQVMTAQQINKRNREYWEQEQTSGQAADEPERARVGTLAGVMSADRVAVTLMHGGREYFFDAETPRGQRVLSLSSDRFVVEQSNGEYHIYDFGAAADPDADPVTQAIAKFESELAQGGSTLKGPHHPDDQGTTDQGDVERNRRMQRKLNSHDWSKHGR